MDSAEPFDDQAHYHAVCSLIETDLAALPAGLAHALQTQFSQFKQGRFSQIAALLPWWLREQFPLARPLYAHLGAAQLYGWWYYWAQDQILDGDGEAALLLGAHLALLRQLELYTELGLAQSPIWPLFRQLTLASALGHQQELRYRLSELANLGMEQLAHFDQTVLLARAQPFFFNSRAQAWLAGHDPFGPTANLVIETLECLTLARQFSDDASDWIDELKQDKLNSVACRFLVYLHQQAVFGDFSQLTAAQVAGQQILHEAFWRELEQANQSLIEQMLAKLRAANAHNLAQLLEQQAQANVALWANHATYRQQLRGFFGLAASE
ncbi:hypothetical protein [Herpetosiphon llansteffanensis]|uniref:hypothetical protein n=1 Tax=Herpetosiphon llansteffanensis TaxID=2094568 RepID=UPI000D7CAEA0|nr:hypothetical protein [Herpetosiphon llansteffanensis]